MNSEDLNIEEEEEKEEAIAFEDVLSSFLKLIGEQSNALQNIKDDRNLGEGASVKEDSSGRITMSPSDLEKVATVTRSVRSNLKKMDERYYQKAIELDAKMLDAGAVTIGRASEARKEFAVSSFECNNWKVQKSMFESLAKLCALKLNEAQKECKHPFAEEDNDGDYHRATYWHNCLSCGKRLVDDYNWSTVDPKCTRILR
jgi:hypothetical protein